MARRYGRNQRRAHRERIAELEAGWPQAREFPGIFTIDHRRVMRFDDRETCNYHDGRKRDATIDFAPKPSEFDEFLRLIDDGFRRSTSVAWRGIAWRIQEMRVSEQAIGPILTIGLIAFNKRAR